MWLSVLMLVVFNYGSAAAEVSPAASALHVLPPQGKAFDDVSNFDATLLDYLTVSICRLEADTCTPVQEFTSTDGKGLDHILLQEEEGELKYHVNWNPSKEDLGHEFEIRFFVAGLQVEAIECTPRAQRTVPIQFRIDNHPLIRAHVLCERGLSAVKAAEVLIAEFSLTMEDLIPVLMASCFDCVDISEVLKDTFGLTAVDTVLTLIDAGCDCEVIGEALESTFGTTADETAGILLNAGCDCEAVGSVLKNTFNVTPQSAAHILISAGCSCEATGDVLRNTFGLSDEEATPILVAAGCDAYLNLLAPMFAPQLRFDGGADNFPMSAQDYYNEVIVTGRWENPTWEEKWLGWPQMENIALSDSVPTYYRAVRTMNNQVRILYWWFYGYQKPCFLNQGRHNGDWEQVMVTLSEDATEVAAVTFWQHSGWYTRLAYSDGQACPPPTSDFDLCSFELFDQTHPVVYVGRIAHGSYSSMGGSPDPIMTCLYHYDVRYFTNPALRLDTWTNLVNIDAATETWRQSDVQWGYEGIKTSNRTDIDDPPVGYMMASCEGDSWYNPVGTNGCWLSQCRAGDKCNVYISLAFCVGSSIIYDISYPIPITDAGLLYKEAIAAALMDKEQMLELLAMVFDEDSETTGQAEQDQSFETLAMVLDESLEATGEEPAVEDDFLPVPESGQITEISPDPSARWPYIAEVARSVLAMTLDIDPYQLRAAFEDGLTPCQICEAQGMDISEVLTAEWPTREGIIQEAVASEFISPDEADWLRGMLAALPELCQEEGQFE